MDQKIQLKESEIPRQWYNLAADLPTPLLPPLGPDGKPISPDMLWAGTEGAICAPETSHAIAAVIDEANKAREEGKEKVILFNYSGHGLMDLTGYDAYLSGKLTDYVLPDEQLTEYSKELENLPKGEMRKSGKW